MKKLAVFLFCAMFIMAAGCAPAKEKPPLKIGLNAWPGYMHAFIAQEKGFFQKNGVKVELVYDKEYAVNMRKYTEGELDGAFYVFSDVIVQAEEGIRSKVVYVCDYSETGDVILGRPELNSLLDLKGRKVGVDGINSFSHFFVLKSLEKAGLREGQLEFEIVPSQDVLKTLEARKIDAGHTWEPTKSMGLKKGYKILGMAKDVQGAITDILVFKAEVTAKRPAEIKAVVRSLLEARQYLYDHREEGIRIMAKASGMSEAEMDEGLKGLHSLDLGENLTAMTRNEDLASLYGLTKSISEFFMARGQLSRLSDMAAIIEPQFVEELGKERQG